MCPVRERRELGVDGPRATTTPPGGGAAGSSEVEAGGGFSVRLQGATLFDLIQFECLKRSRRIVRLRDGLRSGYLYFRDGNVVHAVDGALTGEPAFRSLLRWQRGAFETWDGAWPARETIATQTQTLILGMAQEQDERSRDATPNVLSFPTKETTKETAEPDAGGDRAAPSGKVTTKVPTMNPPAAALAQHTLLRISSDGVAVLRGSPAEAQQLAEVAAYAAQMADVVGDLLLGSGFDLLEVALASGTFAISRQPNGDLLAVKGGPSADPATVRATVERPHEVK
jgi:hypothetical protein